MKVFFPIVLLVAFAHGQIVLVGGGTSSLQEGSGGQATIFFPKTTLVLGGGCGERCGVQLSDSFRWKSYDVTLGDKNVFGGTDAGGVSFQARGLTVTRGNQNQSASVFVGTTGESFSTSFFQTYRAQHFGAGIFWRRRSNRWNFQALSALSGNEKDAAASVRFTGARFGFVGAGGFLQGSPVSNGHVDFAAIKRHLTFSAARQDLFYPSTTVRTNSVGTGGSFGPFFFNGTAIRGTASGRESSGETFGGGLRWQALTVQSSFFASAGQRMFLTSARETFRRHFSFSQTYAAHSFGVGGSYTSNRFTVGVEHSVLFFPAFGFRQVSMLSLSLRIPHTDTAVSLATNFLPNGQAKYSVLGNTWQRGPLAAGAGPEAQMTHRDHHAGKFAIRGSVRDKSGKPVDGAAVKIDGEMVFSNSAGSFEVHVRKMKMVTVIVSPDDFLAPGEWRTLSAPDSATPDSKIEIVVERGK